MIVTGDLEENQTYLTPISFQNIKEQPSINIPNNHEQIMPNLERSTYNSQLPYTTNTNFILPSYLAKRNDIRQYYRINPNILAYGGFSKIYQAENKYGKFAIKIINKNVLKNPNEVLTEAKLSMQLKHKNIVKFYEIYEDFNNIYLVMELCEKGDLVDLLEHTPAQRLSSRLVIDIMLQVFEVVDFLHDKNIIHRDLKLDNCLVKFDQNKNIIIKLTDFGISIFKPKNGKKIYGVAGTEKIEAPEILKGEGYDEKVDEWALGIIMFNLLTGSEAFNTDAQIKNNIMYGKIQLNYIRDDELRNLTAMLLNRDVLGRISVKKALKILKYIKLKRQNMQNFYMSPKSFSSSSNLFLFNQNRNFEENPKKNYTRIQFNTYNGF